MGVGYPPHPIQREYGEFIEKGEGRKTFRFNVSAIPWLMKIPSELT
jgi:hypothetical protein